MSQWYYRKPGMVQDETVGPVTEDQMAALIRGGKVKTATAVSSPKATNGQWVSLSGVDFTAALAKFDRQAKDAQAAADKERARVQAEAETERERLAEERRQQTAAQPPRSPITAATLMPTFASAAGDVGTMFSNAFAVVPIVIGILFIAYFWIAYDPTVSSGDGERVYHRGLQQYQMMGFLFGLVVLVVGCIAYVFRRRPSA